MDWMYWYDLAAGPMLKVSFAVFLAGLAWRVAAMLALAKRMDPAALKNFRSAWALASILRWLLPANVTARENTAATVAGFALHLGLLAVALLFSGHVVLVDQAWDISWWMLPDQAADWLTYACLAGAGFLALRRLALPHVRALTKGADWLALGLTVAPMLTGWLAFHQVGEYEMMISLHALSGNALLLALPFTKLSHAALFFVSRALTGSDFGKRSVGAW